MSTPLQAAAKPCLERLNGLVERNNVAVPCVEGKNSNPHKNGLRRNFCKKALEKFASKGLGSHISGKNTSADGTEKVLKKMYFVCQAAATKLTEFRTRLVALFCSSPQAQ